MADLDLARIKRNVAKMAAMQAPESDIDGYIASEGTTVEAVRAFRPISEGTPAPRSVGGTTAGPGQAFSASGVPMGGDDSPVMADGNRPGMVPAGPSEKPRYGGTAMNATAGVNEGLYGLPGLPVDLAAGAANLGIRGYNAVTGSNVPTIDKPFLGSQHLRETVGGGLGAIAPQLDPRNTTAEDAGDRVARAAGEAAGSSVAGAGVVGALTRGGMLAPRMAEAGANLLGRNSSVGAVAGDAVASGAAGAGAAVGAEAAPDRLKPLASVAGALVGGGAGSVAAGLPAIGREGLDLGRQAAAPLTDAGRQRLAVDRLRDAATDPAMLPEKLEANAKPIVPGSQPTTFQASGDMGVGSLEREMQNRYPAEFMQRRADQNTARRDALDAIQDGGAAETVSAALRQRLKALDEETAGELKMARDLEQARSEALGRSMPPEQAGETLRRELQAGRNKAMERENALWGAVDPNGTLVLPSTQTRASVNDILKGLPKTAKPPAGEEAAIYETIAGTKETMPFRDVAALRSRLSTALADERGRHGKSPAWARMVQLRGAIESDLEDAVSARVMMEEQAVARGEMAEENTMASALLKEQQRWYEQRTEAQRMGQNTGTGVSTNAAFGSRGVSSTSGTEIPGGEQFRDATRDPGVQTGSGPQKLTAADIRAKKPSDPFFIRSRDGQPFVPREPGNPDLGTAPRLDGQGEAPIRLKRSDLKHVSTAGHQADAEILGYSDPWEMVNDIAINWSQMHRGEKGRVQLVIPDEVNGVGIVELTPVDGSDYWRVVTAGRRSNAQLGELLEVRARTPDVAAGSGNTLPRGPTMAGQDERFTQASSSAEYTPQAFPRQEMQPFDEAAKARLDQATAATRERAATFDNRQVGPLLARPSDAAPYNVPDARVIGRLFTAGPGAFEKIQQFRQAAGTPPAMDALEGYAAGSLRKAAVDPETGTIDAGRLQSWRNAHADALRAFPEFEIRIADAERAAGYLSDVSAKRVASLEQAQAGAIGKLMGLESPSDVTKFVGGLLNRQDAVRQIGELRTAIAGDPEAQAGLRRAVADAMTQRLIGNTEAATSGQTSIRSDAFQTFMRRNSAALEAAGFSKEEIGTMQAVADDLMRSNRSLTAVKIPGQSNTAQDSISTFQRVVEAAKENRNALAGAAVGGSFGGGFGAIVGGVGASVLSGLRERGLTQVDHLVRDMMLDPQLARMMLANVTPKQAAKLERSIAQRLRRATAASLAGEAQGEERAPKPPQRRAEAYLPFPNFGSARLLTPGISAADVAALRDPKFAMAMMLKGGGAPASSTSPAVDGIMQAFRGAQPGPALVPARPSKDARRSMAALLLGRVA